MKGFGDQNKSKKEIGNLTTKQYHQQILNNALKNHSDGNISQARKCYQYLIDNGFEDASVFNNYAMILISVGKLKEAELSIRKAIELNPEDATAHSNLGKILQDLGKLKEAELSIRKAIGLNPKDALGHFNLGEILKDLGQLKDAEQSIRKAIELNPNFATAYINLGSILKNIGQLKEAELSIRKAIELNPDFAKAYYSLSLIKYSDNNKIWQDELFSKNILLNKSKEDKIDIYFARANILHKEKKYEESSRYLKLANELKLELKPSKPNMIFKKSKELLIQSDKENINNTELKEYPESIFIVGMPRSGSTLLESILSINTNVNDLGEINIFEESYLEWQKVDQALTLAESYWRKVNNKTELNITTNKWLYNYKYTGIIAQHIPNAKIIHCFRNPLDNILSIYRAHFHKGNDYSSSLVDCTRVYLDQEEIMNQYKNRFRSKIYDLNYDLLVINPVKEIKSLISWLGWKWDDQYLCPHLNPRSVSTASNIQVRSPINSKSIDGWKNYKDMLNPAIEILTQTDRYRDVTS